MKFPVFLVLSFFLIVGSGCSREEPTVVEHPQSQSLEEPTEAPAPSPAQAVVPVQLSPEDMEKAKQAPEGMVFIKGGCFLMGNRFAQEDERPAHQVCLDDFFMDKYEVTQTRWNQVMGFNPSKFVGDDLPVEQVNYYEVREFVEKSNGQCRLPTEAEWEYAARGGVGSRYYWGNLMDGDYAWYQDNSQNRTHAVGQKKPNQYGLYDMMGNVWEWTEDWYEPYYQVREKKNPHGPKTGDYKVIRGGALDSSAGALRITNRTWVHPKNRVFPKVTSYGGIMNEIYNYIGFRCVQPLSGKN